MARKPKLVAVTALVPTYIRDLLKRLAKGERRTLSAYVGNLIIYHPQVQKGVLDYGKEKEG
jgi:hypothetical protein